jgi:hypothetical protein
MLTCVCWKWGDLFSAKYVNTMQAMLTRHLHRPFELVCVTDDPRGITSAVRTERITQWQDTPRCRRRMAQYDRAFAARLGSRILSIDLDVVIVDDITPLVDRREPLVCWKVGYAGVYSGSFVLYDFGALAGLYEAFAADPYGYPLLTGEKNASDQACLNYYLRTNDVRVAEWTEADGLVTWFGGERYRKLQHHGMGPDRPDPPEGARVIVLGSDDKAVLDERRYDWCEEWA